LTVHTLTRRLARQILKLNLENPDVQYSNRLDIREASFHITQVMMKFLYTGTVDASFLEHRGLDLLSAAHKVSILSIFSLTGVCNIDLKLNFIFFGKYFHLF